MKNVYNTPYMADKKSKNKKNNTVKKPHFLNQIISAIMILVAIGVLYSTLSGNPKKSTEITLSQVAELVNNGQVEKISVKGNALTVITKTDGEKTTEKEPETSLADTLSIYGVSAETLRATPITVTSAKNGLLIFLNILSIFAPIVFIGLFFWYMTRQMNSAGGMKALSFGQSKARITDPNGKDKKITFADVAGNLEAKQELLDVVDFLKFPKKYFDVGARIPKGVLLAGSPGTGKTLLARAVAGEAGVPFFHLSGSEFVEMFVGVGASRVRDLFTQAKAASPAIIFIDEIDAVGRARGIGIGGGNDEREQTLNQILVEMDGFDPNEKVIILAATNRSDVLDPALLRPGRFDRTVMLDLPDRKDRLAILQIHANEKPLADDVKLEVIAERTAGLSGADLQSLMNEGAIFAARDNRTKVAMNDLISAIEKVMIGTERKSHLHTEKDRKIVAYHEAGHALVASVLPNTDPVHKVSIVARGYAGGYTMKIGLEENKLTNRAQFLDDLAMSLGGYVAEKIVFGDTTTGPSSDLQVSSRLARNMVTKWGMSELLGPVAYSGSQSQSVFGEGVKNNDYSETTAREIDNEVRAMMQNAEKRATEVIEKYRDALEAIVKKLFEVETLEQDAYNEIIKKFGIEPKTKTT
jgi:cell division protease FtsH